MAPVVSICLPTYNGEQFLAQAIESALSQTFSDFELIIVDDCSQDRSFDIAQEYARKDSRIQAFQNQANVGLFANYNQTMTRASGKLIKLFAQDDLWHEKIVARSVESFRFDENLALLSVHRHLIDRDGNSLPVKLGLEKTTRMPGRDIVRDCMLSRANLIGEPSTVMFPRAIMRSGFDCRYYHLGDLEFWFRILSQGDYLYLHEPLCRFRRHPESTTNRNIKGLLFALDLIALGDQYGGIAAEAGMTVHDLKIAIAYDVSTFVNELVASGTLTLDALLEQNAHAPVERQLRQFKELAFYALLAGASVQAKGQSQVEALQNQLHMTEETLTKLQESKLWRSTSLLREAALRITGGTHATDR